MTEEWRKLPGFNDRYEVSDHGRFRRNDFLVRSNFGQVPFPAKVVSPDIQRSGHYRIGIYFEGKRYRWQLHRLVLTAFVGPCPEGHEACHRDGNPANNHVSNLYWGTRSQNRRDSVRHGTHNSRLLRARAMARTACPAGHEYTPENVYIEPTGRRECRACKRERTRRSKRKIRADRGAA